MLPPQFSVSVFDEQTRIDEVVERLEREASGDDLQMVLQQSGLTSLRVKACELLGTRMVKAAVSTLVDQLEDQDTAVRAAAATALGDIFARAAMPPRHRIPDVLAALSRRWEVEESSDVRTGVLHAFGALGDPSVRSLLEEAADHPEEAVRAQARWSLSQLDRRAHA